jgi:cob(I)alamin adenosyltransferase
MVVLNKIYTRTGDDGSAALGSGERRPKSDPRFEAIGAVDELNAHVGLARFDIPADIDLVLARIQNDLFDLGADLAVPETERTRDRLRIAASQVTWLEGEIDRLNAELQPLTSFVLPGGTRQAAAFHLCRTVARRAERVMVALGAREPLNPDALRYVNRLSDFFFVAARHSNNRGGGDVLWVPGKNR